MLLMLPSIMNSIIRIFKIHVLPSVLSNSQHTTNTHTFVDLPPLDSLQRYTSFARPKVTARTFGLK